MRLFAHLAALCLSPSADGDKGGGAAAIGPDFAYLLGQAKEQIAPIISQIESGQLDALGGAQQLVQTYGGFVDLLPDHAQQLVKETARQLAIYMGADVPVLQPTREQVRAATPLADNERLELETLRQIVATLNPEGSIPQNLPYAGKQHQLAKPGEPGYDPAKDPNL